MKTVGVSCDGLSIKEFGCFFIGMKLCLDRKVL